MIIGLDLNEYQNFCETTWFGDNTRTPERNIAHAALGLAGETGEVIELVKKADRGDGCGLIDQTKLTLELGDALYYIVTLARLNGIRAQDIVNCNVAKLRDRMRRGVLHGSGDNR